MGRIGNVFVSKLCRSNYVPHKELISVIVVAEALLMDRNKFESQNFEQKEQNKLCFLLNDMDVI